PSPRTRRSAPAPARAEAPRPGSARRAPTEARCLLCSRSVLRRSRGGAVGGGSAASHRVRLQVRLRDVARLLLCVRGRNGPVREHVRGDGGVHRNRHVRVDQRHRGPLRQVLAGNFLELVACERLIPLSCLRHADSLARVARSCRYRSREEVSRASHAWPQPRPRRDRKSTRLNSSHVAISYAVFCLKKKKNKEQLKNMVDTTR